MKKLILTIAIVISCLCSTTLSAQNNDDAYGKALRTYMESSGSMASFEAAINQLFMMAGNVPAEKKSEIRTQAFDKLIDLMTPIYQKHISLQDLDAINRFYQTPEGRHIAEAQPKIAVESTQVGQQWGMWLQSAIQDAGK
ncbi:DUF2059 domain-containing protein [uncultured Alistipes sp.]|uniref:DUF2059 domain-containing protein n=1 Tax=uncultured Alistipes sp. TaxID=538949 RepID=UPI00261857E0|nr:DUF2059 domain-containing protein [uncultured Alistipes sp.]